MELMRDWTKEKEVSAMLIEQQCSNDLKAMWYEDEETTGGIFLCV